MDTSVQCLPERILVHYQFQMLIFRRLNQTTPEMVAKKIKAMKDNKSPGMDGILPKLLMEIWVVEQISIPLARMFNFIKRGSGFF